MNDDCWLYVLRYHTHDFRTLARMMQVSKQLFLLATPILYSNLFDPKRTSEYKYWSTKKILLLSGLLLTSSGFLTPKSSHGHNKVGNKGQDEEVQEGEGQGSSSQEEIFQYQGQLLDSEDEQDDDGDDDDEPSYGRQAPKFRLPMMADYFSFIQRLPTDLSSFYPYGVGLSDRKSSKNLTTNPARFWIHHARVLCSLEINAATLRELLPHVKKFENVSSLAVRNDSRLEQEEFENDTVSALDLTIDFIQQHIRLFPGKLEFVFCGEIREFEIMVKDMMIVGPTALRLGTNVIPAEVIRAMVKNSRKLEIYNLDHFKAKNAQHLAGLLQQCRKLEELSVESDPGLDHFWSRAFSWAVEERSQNVQLKQQQLLEQALPEQPSRQLQQHTEHSNDNALELKHMESSAVTLLPSLVPLRKFKGKKVKAQVVCDILDGFRDSISSVDYLGSRAASHIHWAWPLSKLTKLDLKSCRLDFDYLALCPLLRSLKLKDVVHNGRPVDTQIAAVATGEESHAYHVPSRGWSLFVPSCLQVLRLEGGDAVTSFNFNSFNDLSASLVDLHLTSVPDKIRASVLLEMIRGIDSLDWKPFKRLQRLELSAGGYEPWQTKLLSKGLLPHLRHLIIRDATIKPLDWILQPENVIGSQNRIEILEIRQSRMAQELQTKLLKLVAGISLESSLSVTTTESTMTRTTTVKDGKLEMNEKLGFPYLQRFFAPKSLLTGESKDTESTSTTSSTSDESSFSFSPTTTEATTNTGKDPLERTRLLLQIMHRPGMQELRLDNDLEKSLVMALGTMERTNPFGDIGPMELDDPSLGLGCVLVNRKGNRKVPVYVVYKMKGQ